MNEMKDIRHLMNEKLVGNLMKPFIDECGIIHIAYMATAMFYQRKWLPLVCVVGKITQKGRCIP